MKQPIDGGVPLNFLVSPEASRRIAAYKSACHAFNADLATWERDTDELRAIPESAWSIDHDEKATRLRATERELVVREIQLRETFGNLLTHIREVEQPAAIEASHQKYLQVKADIEKRLRKAGYIDYLPSGTPCLTENMVERHPDVVTAWQTNQTYRYSDLSQNFQANAKTLKECRAALASYKQRAMAGLAN